MLLRASTQRSPASIGNPQAMHFVVNNSFQSEKIDILSQYFFLYYHFSGLTLFTVGQAVLQVEREVGEDLAAVGAAEALWMEVGAQRLQTVLKQKIEFVKFCKQILCGIISRINTNDKKSRKLL